MQPLSLRVSVGVVLLASLAGSKGDRLVFAPKAGVALTTTMSSKLELTVASSEGTSRIGEGGETHTLSGDIPVSTLTVVESATLLDSYGEVVDGRPKTIDRDFLKCHAKPSIEGSPNIAQLQAGIAKNECDSGLHDRTVHFAWNDEKDEFDRSLKDAKDNETYLVSELAPEIDFRQLLPPSGASVDAKWKVDANLVHLLLAPGGNFYPDSKPEPRRGPSSTKHDIWFPLACISLRPTIFWQDLKGNLSLRRLADSDGQAVIEFEFDVESRADVSAESRRRVEHGLAENISFDLDQFVAGKLKGKGTLVWDAVAKHAKSVTCKTDVELNESTDMMVHVSDEPDPKRRESHVTCKITWSGTLETSAAVE